MSERTLNRDAPTWLDCEICDSDDVDIKHTTFPDCPPEHIYDGDSFVCRDCGATGVGNVDSDIEPAWVSWAEAYVEVQDE